MKRDVLVEVAVAALTRAGRIWVQQRREEGVLDECWEFPGGKLVQGETPVRAVIREVAEETGFRLDAACLKFLVRVDHRYPDRSLRLHFFAQELPVEADLKGPGRWVTGAELKKMTVPAANARALEALDLYAAAGDRPPR